MRLPVEKAELVLHMLTEGLRRPRHREDHRG
jgi:hypothetical protein